jgi:hypothetical protein
MTPIRHATRRMLWLTGLHLDRATAERKVRFYAEIRRSQTDAILISGNTCPPPAAS